MSLEVFLPPLCAYTAPLRGLAVAGAGDLLLSSAASPPHRPLAFPASPGASSSPSRRHLHLLHNHHLALLWRARVGAERVKVSWSAWKGKAGIKFSTLAQHARTLSDGPRLWKQAASAGAGSHPWLIKSMTLLGGRPAASSSLDVSVLLRRMRGRAAAAQQHNDDDSAAGAAPLEALVAINRMAAATDTVGADFLPVLRAAEACAPESGVSSVMLRLDSKRSDGGEGGSEDPPVINFSGRWRLDHARSDKVWDMMRRLGARPYLQPFADIGSLVNEISHDPVRKVWHEKLEKFTWLTHRVTLWLDGREVEAQHPMDGGSKILSRSFVENGAVVTETQYAKYGAAQRVERYLLLEGGPSGRDLEAALDGDVDDQEAKAALELNAVVRQPGDANVVYQVKNVVSFYDNPADPASLVTTRVYMRTFVPER